MIIATIMWYSLMLIAICIPIGLALTLLGMILGMLSAALSGLKKR